MHVALSLPLSSSEHAQRDSKFLHLCLIERLQLFGSFNKHVLQLLPPNIPILAGVNAFHQTHFGVSSLI